MCSICHMSPCPAGCPNAPDPPRVATCALCFCGIIPGDEYAKIDGVNYCESCIDNMPYCKLIPLLGGKWEEAEHGQIVKCGDCGRVIEPGEEFGILDGVIRCEECLDEIPYSELVEQAGHDWNTAREEDIYDGYDG